MATQINKSQLFKIAHSMLRKAKFSSMAEALRQAWRVLKLRAAMLAGKAEFAFRKVDGTIRKAVGTLANINYTPALAVDGKPRRQRPVDQICYFDIEKKSFRSFNAWSLV